MSKGSILLVSYHFYPSREVGAKRPSETAIHLHRMGYDVTVIRGVARGSAPDDPPELAGLRLVSVRIPARHFTAAWKWLKGVVRRGRANAPSAPAGAGEPAARVRSGLGPLRWLRRQIRAVDTAFQGDKRWICKAALKVYLECRRRRYDLVVASGPPIASYICAWLASRLKGMPLVLDMRDPWYLHGDDERSDEIMVLDHPLSRLENLAGLKCVAASTAIVAASPGIRAHTIERLNGHGEVIEVIRNGYDRLAHVDAEPPRGKLEMLYAGTLYWNRNPFPFLEALERVLQRDALRRDKIRLRLVGNCRQWNGVALQPWLEARGMADVVEILPFVEPASLSKLIAETNVLVNFSQGQPRQIPAKSYEYLASGRDVIVVAEPDSDVADLFREARLGEIVDPADIQGLEAVIGLMYERYVVCSERAARPAVDLARFARSTQLAEFEKVVERVLRRVTQ